MDSQVRASVDRYLEAFAARDLAGCLAAFADDAVIDFQLSTFAGPEEIEAWHAERFAAGMQLLRVESVETDGDSVHLDVVIASDRLKAWRIRSLAARVTLRLSAGRIVEARMAPRLNPFRADQP